MNKKNIIISIAVFLFLIVGIAFLVLIFNDFSFKKEAKLRDQKEKFLNSSTNEEVNVQENNDIVQ